MPDPLRDQLQRALGTAYVLDRELGGGGMSRVFAATETALGRRVVIKTLPDDALSAAAAERFRREILTAARLQHPNIVPVLAAGNADGVPWFSMPWVDGASLREQLAGGAMPPAAAVAVLRDVARALAAAHAQGIVHRDVKPENVLLARGAAVVTDFGVAKAFADATRGGERGGGLTAVGVAIGTPSYMAPEQIAADPALDHRADLYAWGLVAYELLAGRRPFHALSGAALAAAQLTAPPPPLGAAAPHVPPAVAALVMRCLAKDPAARPQTADELVEALDVGAVASGGAAVDAAPAPAARGRRRRWAAAGVAAVVVAAAGAFAAARARGGAAVDDRSIAVAPFRVGGAAPAVRYLREGVPDLMGPQLASVDGVRSAAFRVVLDRWRRAAGAADADLDDAGALRVAGGAGAGQLVLGDVVGDARHLTLSARLLRVRDGRALASGRVEGPADSLGALTARLLTELLAVRDGATQARVRSVLSARPDALLAYLSGERLFRAGRYFAAGDAFAEAHRADTAFALAALRIAAVNGWTLGRRNIPGSWLARAWAHRDRLTGEDSLELLAWAGATYPRPMPLRARLRYLGELAERAGTSAVWYFYGDRLFHDGPAAGEPDAWPRALAAFRRAEALDSSFAQALEHQPQILMAAGDTAAAAAALRRQTALGADGDILLINRTMLGRIRRSADGRSAIDSIAPGVLPFMASQALLGAGQALSDGVSASGGAPDVAAADTLLARAARQPPSPLFLTLAREVAWNTGRPSRVPPVPPDRQRPEELAEEVVAGLAWDGDSARAAAAASSLSAWLAAHPGDSATVPHTSALFYSALWAFNRGDTAAVERARAALLRTVPPADAPWRRDGATVYEALLGAHLAVARRAPDARARLERVDSMLTDAIPVDRRLVRAAGNQLAADLWERAGDPRRALAANRRLDGVEGWGMLASTRLRRQARLAEQLGDRRQATAALRAYVGMRAQAEPTLRADLADARARLARLARLEGGGP